MGEQNEHMELTVGAVVEGKVKSLSKFGAFITLPDGSTGMVHISEIAHAYVNDIREHLTEGQDVKVMIISRENGKTNLSIKRTLPAPAKPQTYVKDKDDPFANVGRNDPCPCGSGLKFKKCHGKDR